MPTSLAAAPGGGPAFAASNLSPQVPTLSQLLGQAPVPPGQDPNVAAVNNAAAPGAGGLSGLWSGIQQFQLNPAMTALGAQTDLTKTAGTISQQQLADSAQQQSQEAGFSQAQLGVQGANLGLSNQQLQATAGPGGFQQQQQGLTAAEQAFGLGQSQRALRSAATATGSVNTSGTQQKWSDLLSQYGFQQQQAGLTTKEQNEAYQIQQGQLANAAKSLGISSQEVTSRLNNALNQLGLQGSLDTLGVAQAIQQLQSGFLSGPMATAIQEVLGAAGLPIQAFGSGGNPAVPSDVGSGAFGTPAAGQPGYGTNSPLVVGGGPQ